MEKTSTKEYVTEEEIRDEDVCWENSSALCAKKANHDKYVCVANLPESFPQNFRHRGNLISLVQSLVKLVAYITLIRQTTGGTKSVHGSGMVQRVRRQQDRKCPDRKCTTPDSHVFGIVTVTTVLHVINLPEDAEKCKVILNYDDDELGSARREIHGLRLLDNDKDTGALDWCAIECHTHDLELLKQLEDDINTYEQLQSELFHEFISKQEQNRGGNENIEDIDENFMVVVGHPHGGPKKISFGEIVDEREILKEVREQQEWCRYYHTAATCPGSSGSPLYILGQPLCGYGYWFGHPHNHSAYERGCNRGRSSVGVNHKSLN